MSRGGAVAVALGAAAVIVGSSLLGHYATWNVSALFNSGSLLGHDVETLVVVVVPGALLLAAGLLFLRRQPGNLVGPLLVLDAACQGTFLMLGVPSPLVVTLGILTADLNAAVTAHLVLVWPSGRILTGVDRFLVTAAYVLALSGRTVVQLFDRDVRGSLAHLSDDPALEHLSRLVLDASLVVMTLAILVRIWQRWRTTPRGARPVMRPVVAAVPVLAVVYALGFPLANSDPHNTLGHILLGPVMWLIAFGVLPAAFLLSALRLRMARGAVRGAVLGIGGLPTVPQLEKVLRERLKDPGLQVLRYSRTADAFVDRDGRLVPAGEWGDGQALSVLEQDGVPEAAIVHDQILLQDPGLVTAVTGAVRLALDSSRLRQDLHARGGDAAGLPVGEVTLLFGDIEHSTLWLDHMPEQYADLLAEFRATAAEVVEAAGGRVVDSRGDEVFAVLPEDVDRVEALRTAVRLQSRFATAAWPQEAKVKVRLGLHRGRPQRTRDGYVGLDVHTAARVMSAAHGGQVLASGATAGLQASGLSLTPLGVYQLAGIRESATLVQVEDEHCVTRFPEPRATRLRSPSA
jgi:class 3 adenylate cyclase